MNTADDEPREAEASAVFPDSAPRRRKKPSAVVLTIWVAAFTAVLAGLAPSAVVAVRTENTFMLGLIIGAALGLVLLDGVALGLMLRARRDSPLRPQGRSSRAS